MMENNNSEKAIYNTWCLDSGVDVRSAELNVLMLTTIILVLGDQACLS